ncbi:MAG: hypothetical protein L0Y70_22405 [Gemmataceae bacterium]|nr:hypothetical protein [Gemmataceae bacterium]
METASSDAVPRAERLLKAMHSVFSHDLPNQLVVIQSLAVLLDQEEKAKLSPDGVDHLARLAGATRKANRLVQFLKQMARLEKWQEPMETIHLPFLASEVRAKIGADHFGGSPVSFVCDWSVLDVKGPPTTLAKALVAILQCGLEPVQTPEVEITLSSRQAGHDVRLDIVLSPWPGAQFATEQTRAVSQDTMLQSLEMKLAVELLTCWGAQLRMPPQGVGEWRASVIIPAG